MITYETLMSWNPGALEAAAEAINNDVRKRLVDQQDEIDGAAKIPASWHGDSADAARHRVADLRDGLNDIAANSSPLAEACETAAAAIRTAQRHAEHDHDAIGKQRIAGKGWTIVRASSDGVEAQAPTLTIGDGKDADVHSQADVDKVQSEVNRLCQDLADWIASGELADEELAQSLTGSAHHTADGGTGSICEAGKGSEPEGGEEGGVPPVIEDGHKVLEWGERGLKSLKTLGKDILEPIDAAKAEAARESKNVLSEVWNEMKSEAWGKAGEFGEGAGKLVGDAAVGVGGAIAGWDQWKEDSEDKDLSTGERVDRTATKAGLVVAGQMAGGAFGEAAGGAAGGIIGSVVPGVGNVAGASVGATVGELAGAVAGGIAGDKVADVINDHYNGAGHMAAHFWHKIF